MTILSEQHKKPPSSASKPWYRHRWPWLLMVMPAIAVIGCMLTIWLAITSNDGLVEDDYYKKGMAIDKVIDRDRKAQTMQLNAQILVAEDRKALRVIFNQPLTDTVTLTLLHPTRTGYDQIITLQRTGPQLFSATLNAPLARLPWKIEISNTGQTWRLRSQWNRQNNNMAILTPSPT